MSPVRAAFHWTAWADDSRCVTLIHLHGDHAIADTRASPDRDTPVAGTVIVAADARLYTHRRSVRLDSGEPYDSNTAFCMIVA